MALRRHPERYSCGRCAHCVRTAQYPLRQGDTAFDDEPGSRLDGLTRRQFAVIEWTCSPDPRRGVSESSLLRGDLV